MPGPLVLEVALGALRPAESLPVSGELFGVATDQRLAGGDPRQLLVVLRVAPNLAGLHVVRRLRRGERLHPHVEGRGPTPLDRHAALFRYVSGELQRDVEDPGSRNPQVDFQRRRGNSTRRLTVDRDTGSGRVTAHLDRAPGLNDERFRR